MHDFTTVGAGGESTEFGGRNLAISKYTAKQLTLVMEQIANSANSLSSFARRAAELAGRTDAAEDLHIVQMIAERIGALADLPTGGSVVGSIDDWSLGPYFNQNDESRRGAAQ